MRTLIPAKNPHVPVRPVDGPIRRFRACCRVTDDGKHCGWTYTASIRASVEEQARWHRSEHQTAWGQAHDKEESHV